MTDFAARLAELRARFILRAHEDGRALRAADSTSALIAISHGLSGAAGTFGFPAVSDAAQRLEEALEAGLADAELARLKAELIERLDALGQDV